jgi:hypothetical protein
MAAKRDDIDWENVDWDRSNVAIAAELCVCKRTVVTRRVAAGRSEVNHSEHGLAANDPRLGTMSDMKLARILGCHEVTVGKHRRRLGIPVFNGFNTTAMFK